VELVFLSVITYFLLLNTSSFQHRLRLDIKVSSYDGNFVKFGWLVITFNTGILALWAIGGILMLKARDERANSLFPGPAMINYQKMVLPD
jgi:hypothetical protein